MVSAKRVFDSFWKNHIKQAEAACKASCKGGVFSKKTLMNGGKRNKRINHSSKAKPLAKKASKGTAAKKNSFGKHEAPKRTKARNTTTAPLKPVKFAPLNLPKKVVTPAVTNVLKRIRGQRHRNVVVDKAAYNAMNKTVKMQARK